LNLRRRRCERNTVGNEGQKKKGKGKEGQECRNTTTRADINKRKEKENWKRRYNEGRKNREERGKKKLGL